MTVEELYQYTKERNCEDSQLYVAVHNYDDRIEWTECCVEDTDLSFYDGEVVIEI